VQNFWNDPRIIYLNELFLESWKDISLRKINSRPRCLCINLEQSLVLWNHKTYPPFFTIITFRPILMRRKCKNIRFIELGPQSPRSLASQELPHILRNAEKNRAHTHAILQSVLTLPSRLHLSFPKCLPSFGVSSWNVLSFCLSNASYMMWPS
jgi:hypothetical protein